MIRPRWYTTANHSIDQVGFDFSDLMQAEAAVALLGPTGLHTRQVAGLAVVQFDAEATGPPGTEEFRSGLGLPPDANDALVTAVRERLRDLAEQWRHLGNGGAIDLTYGVESR